MAASLLLALVILTSLTSLFMMTNEILIFSIISSLPLTLLGSYGFYSWRARFLSHGV